MPRLQLVQVRPGTAHSSSNPVLIGAGNAADTARKQQRLLPEAELRYAIKAAYGAVFGHRVSTSFHSLPGARRRPARLLLVEISGNACPKYASHATTEKALSSL